MSLLMPYPLTIAVAVFSFIWFLCRIKTVKAAFFHKSNILLLCLLPFLIAVPLFYGHFIGALVGVVISIYLFLFLVMRQLFKVEIFNTALDLCCLMSFVCMAFAISEKITAICLYGNYLKRSTGGMLNANYLGMACEFIIIIAIYRILSSNKRGMFYVLTVFAAVVSMMMCDCQSAWLAVITAILLFLFLNGYEKQGFLFCGMAVLLVIGAFLIPGLLPRIQKLPQNFSTRSDIWLTALKSIKEHLLFGQGPMAYIYAGKEYGGYISYHSHSLFIEPLLCYGLVGTAILVAYIVTFVKSVISHFIKRQNRMISTLIIAVLSAIFVHGITDIPLIWVQTAGMMFLILSSAGFEKSDEFCKKTIDNQQAV